MIYTIELSIKELLAEELKKQYPMYTLSVDLADKNSISILTSAYMKPGQIVWLDPAQFTGTFYDTTVVE